jgi:membrane associated rhomboid family serine protease
MAPRLGGGTFGSGGGFGGGFSGGLGFPRLEPVIKKLLLVLAGIWLFSFLLSLSPSTQGLVFWSQRIFGLDPDAWLKPPLWLPVWQPLTYALLHSASPWHLIGNALYLYFFGGLLVERIGERRFLWFLLAAVLLGGVASLLWKLLLGIDALTIGISAGALAVVAAVAVLQPHTPVVLLFIPVPLFVLALILVGLDLVGALQQLSAGGRSAVDHFAHLAGALLGFVAARRGWIYLDPSQALADRRKVVLQQQRQSDEARLDQLLARIHSDGIGSLSASEREFLKRMSQR